MSNLEILFAAVIIMAIVAGLLHVVTRKPKIQPPPTLQAMREEALLDGQRQLHMLLMERDVLEGSIRAMESRVERMKEDLEHDVRSPGRLVKTTTFVHLSDMPGAGGAGGVATPGNQSLGSPGAGGTFGGAAGGETRSAL